MSTADALTAIQTALDAVKPIAWCTPASVIAVTQAATTAARSGAATLALTPSYPEIPVEEVRSALSLARSAADMLPDHPLLYAIIAMVDDAEATVDAISARSDQTFSDWSRRQHGHPEPDTVDAAWRILEEPLLGEVEAKVHSAADLQAAATAALEQYELDGWTVVALERLSTVAVDVASRQVRIRQDAAFRRSDMARLLVHEIGGHVLRGENALRQPDPVASFALGDATTSEEGLAAWLEVRFGVASPRIHRLYAARAVAAELAEREGILSVIRTLQPTVGWDDATSVALRVKRGLSDLNAPGGFLKDQAYLSGLRAISDHLASNPDDLPAMMSTKWPLEHLAVAKQLVGSGGLHLAALLPDAGRLQLSMFV